MQVNKIIQDAEEKAMQEEAAIGGKVLLKGDNWQEAAR
jgi:small nuclear ribonucleoprotein (snRNP)-like protein